MPEEPALKVKRLQDMKLSRKRVILRVDFNVPLNSDGGVRDNSRIRESLPTIKFLLKEQARVVILSHLGRPKGKPDPRLTLKPAAEELSKLLGCRVSFCEETVGLRAEKAAKALKPGEILLMENLRFNPGEEEDSASFAGALSKLGDIFIQDAFGSLHRAHASTDALPRRMPSAVGLLVQKEIEFLDRALGNPQRPFLAIIGGAKVSGKLGVMKRLVERVDSLLIGGGMAYTFLHAQGISVGRSLVEKEMLDEAKSIIEKAFARQITCLLPADHAAVKELRPDSPVELTQGMAIPPDMIGVDIGPGTVDIFAGQIKKSKTIFWNGPLGVFEMEPFAKGSLAVANAVAKQGEKAGVVTIAGGGDTLALVAKAGVAGSFSHLSTGGGASLEFVEGKILPGIKALTGS